MPRHDPLSTSFTPRAPPALNTNLEMQAVQGKVQLEQPSHPPGVSRAVAHHLFPDPLAFRLGEGTSILSMSMRASESALNLLCTLTWLDALTQMYLLFLSRSVLKTLFMGTTISTFVTFLSSYLSISFHSRAPSFFITQALRSISFMLLFVQPCKTC